MSRVVFSRGCSTTATAERRICAILSRYSIHTTTARATHTRSAVRSTSGQLKGLGSSKAPFSTQAPVGLPQVPGDHSGEYWAKALVAAAVALPVTAVVLLRSDTSNSEAEHDAEKSSRGGIQDVLVKSSADGAGGRRIQDFYVLQDITLGHGQHGTVSTAVDRETGEVVAVKRVPRCKASEEHFEEEIEAHRHAGEHPNIVGLKGVFSSEDCWYIVMELAEGGELYDRLTTAGAIQKSEVRGLLREITDAVAHIHSRGIVHGDIKPENLLLSESPPVLTKDDGDQPVAVEPKLVDVAANIAAEESKLSDSLGVGGRTQRRASGKVLLADFGSSFRLKQGAGAGVADGRGEEGPRAVKEYTAAYSAPEVVSEGSVGQKADVWSLGVIAYVMVKGHHPFDPTSEADEEEIVENVVHAEPDWNGVEPQAANVIRKMLSRNPNERPSAREVLESSWLQVTEQARA